MDIRFIRQRKPEHITVMDEIELYNCEGGYMPGNYTVADVEPNGDVTLVGKGELSGVIAVICMGAEGAEAEDKAGAA